MLEKKRKNCLKKVKKTLSFNEGLLAPPDDGKPNRGGASMEVRKRLGGLFTNLGK